MLCMTKSKKNTVGQDEKKIVKINCRGAGELSIDFLTPLQGGLKTLLDDNYKKLRNVIAAEGITEPISIWEDPSSGKTMILNGHQRVHTLRKMRDDGWVIPQIPVNMVEARDFDHAKRLVLQLTSQYGTINPESAFEFMNELGVTADEIGEFLNFADFDMTRFVEEYFKEDEEPEEKIDVSAHERKKKGDDEKKFKHKCPNCAHEFN